MTCGHCAGQVTDALSALKGVHGVQVPLVPGEASTVTVTSEAPVPVASVRSAVEASGYALAWG